MAKSLANLAHAIGVVTPSVILFLGSAETRAAEDTNVGEDNVIEEIVVTARQRAESAQDVPVSINALDKSLLDTYAMTSIEDVAAFAPGFIGQETIQGGAAFYIRGVGSNAANPLIEQGVAINIDGVQSSAGNIVKMAQFDLEQVDVLRGPQALFFGKNSPGGVVSFRTADPGETFESEMTVSYENEAEEKAVEGFISGPISDSLGARLAFSYSEMDGWSDIITRDVPGVALPSTEDKYPNRDELFLRGTLLFEPSDSFDARLKVNFADRDGQGGANRNMQRVSCPLGLPQAVVPVPECKANEKVVGGNMPAAALETFVNLDPSEPAGFSESEQMLAALEANWHFGAYTLTWITGWAELDQAWQAEFSIEPASLNVNANSFDQEQFSQELRLTSNLDGDWNWMIGAFYEDEDTLFQQSLGLSPLFGLFDLGAERNSQEGETFSVFAQVDFQVTERFGISGGLRYTDEEKVLTPRFGLGGVLVEGAKESVEFDNVSPQLTFTYDVGPDSMLFLSYREGFKSGGFDSTLGRAAQAVFAGASLAYDEETISGIEGGLKARFFDRTLQFNAIAFDYDYEDLQLSTFDAITFTQEVRNVSESKLRGVEMDVIWLPRAVEGLTVRAAFAYLDAEYEDFLMDCYTGQTIALGCNLTLVPASPGAPPFPPTPERFTQQDLSGERIPHAPEYSGSLGLVYETPLGILGGSTLSIATDFVYSDEFQTALTASPGAINDSNWKVHAAIRLLSEKWEFSLIGRNLTEEYDFVNALDTPFTGTTAGVATGTEADLVAFVSRGREILFKATYRFN